MRGKKERFSGAAAEAKGNKRKKEPEEKGKIFLVFEGSGRQRGKKKKQHQWLGFSRVLLVFLLLDSTACDWKHFVQNPFHFI